MITRIPTTRISSATPTTCNKSKSRATMQHHTNIIPVSQPITAAVHRASKRTTTTMRRRRYSLTTMQILVLVLALPPPLEQLLSVVLSTRGSFAVEALPITSKPIESTAENLAWQAWLMLPPEQKMLEKSRKVTPKSIFSLPFRDCPPGHQLFQSRCIPTVNINQSDLLAQQVLGLFVGSEAGGAGGAGNDNAYEFDYEEEDYGLGFGGGESVVMYDSPQPLSGGSAAGPSDTQQPPARDEPLKFNLFQQKYPTNDYEADISSSAMEGSGGARPLTEMLSSNLSEGDRVEVAGNGSDASADLFNSSQFLDVVQGYLQQQQHATASDVSGGANTTIRNVTITDYNNHISNENNTKRQGLSDSHVASSNISAFTVGDIDAIILPASSSGMSTTTDTSGGVGVGVTVGNLEPQRISLFKDNSSLHLVTAVIAHSDSDKRKDGEDALPEVSGDLVAAAQQQHVNIAQFLRADALLPLSSIAPYLTTTAASTIQAADAGHAAATHTTVAKEERPRSVTQRNTAAAPANTDAQETSFITTTEPESTTNFQIDETTVVEANDESDIPPEGNSLLEAISKQQQLELQKSKVEPVEYVAVEDVTAINETTTTSGNDTTTETIVNETDETPTRAKQAIEVSERSVETTTQTETTLQPLPSAIALPSIKFAATTAKSILTTTPATTDRFRNAPAAAVAAIRIATITSTTAKQVSAFVTAATPQAAPAAAGEKTTTSTMDVVSDVPRSGDNDLVNVIASSHNSDTNNGNTNKPNNKKSPVHSVAAETVTATGETNIEQELRMINELVKGKRQLAAMKMAAIKTTAAAASATIEPKLEVKQFANVAENEENASADDVVATRRNDIAEATTTTPESAITTKATTAVKSPLDLSNASASEVPQTTTATANGIRASTLAKMESGTQPATAAPAISVENIDKIIATFGESVEPTTTISAESDFETEATAVRTEATGATLWSRIMPIFGFGIAAIETEPTTAVATTTIPSPAAALIGSISSSNSSNVSNIRKSSSASRSDVTNHSFSKKIISSSNGNNNFDGHSRQNSKIIRIDQLSDESVAAAAATAATTNTLEESIATNTATSTTTTTTMAKANTKTAIADIAPEPDVAVESPYWWLPAGWRAHRNTNEGQPLLFRLWSAFPESQMKAKIST